MSTSSLPAPDPKLKKKGLSLHFNLPSFRKSTGERPEADSDEIARVRKAAAWQWYTRGVPDMVAPTKRAPAAAASNSSTADNNSNNGLKNMQRRSMSRFKAEATSATNHPSAQGTAPSPLYDEFELSGLKSHMSELVQRLQKQQDEIKLSHKQAASRATGFQSPLSAIHKFFRKISGAMQKSSGRSSTNSPQISANHGPVPDAADDDEMQYHYHHYIHHHHHHYHYAGGCSPAEENFDMIRRRRHSESSDYRHTLVGELCEADEEDPIKPSSLRRRHSESFSNHAMRRLVDPREGIGGPRAPSPALSTTRVNSERFSTHNKMPGAKVEQHIDDDNGDDADEFKSTPRIRRHSAESFRSYKLDCATLYHEAELYKLSPSSTLRRRPSNKLYPASNYNKATEYESPNKAGTRSHTLRQTPMRMHFENLSERHFVESLSESAQFSTGNLAAGRAM